MMFNINSIQNSRIILLVIVCIACGLSSCSVSLKNASIPIEIKSFWVSQFNNVALNSPAGIEVDFTDALVEKFQSESRLQLRESNSDLTYEGTITTYRIEFLDPNKDESSQLNRLIIEMDVSLENEQDEKANWSQKFSDFAEFSPDEDYDQVEEALINSIFQQITEDIFNKSFGNW